MTLPVCAELPLMLLFSMLCTDEDGNVVDIRVDNYDAPLLFSTPSRSSSSSDIDTFSSSSVSTEVTTGNNNNDNNDKPKHGKQRIPYCDEITDAQYKSIGICGDRKDGDDINGYPCGNGILKADWRDCDGGLYGDNEDEIKYVPEDYDKDENHIFSDTDSNTNAEDIGEELGNLMQTDEEDNDSDSNADAQ